MCLAATLFAIWIHVVYLQHAGALWRDEVGGVQLATLPTISETWQMLPHGGFPFFFPLAVRLWVGAGLGSDAALRILGFGFGLSVLVALWWNSHCIGYRAPFVSIGLLAANLTLVRSGDSLRAYGCGCAFMLVTFGLVWALIRAPTWGRFLQASVAGILSVQSLYQNAVLLLALCCAAGVVCVRRRQQRTIRVVLGVGLLAALSLLPYIQPVIQSQDWWVVSKTGLHPLVLWDNLSSALGAPLVWQKWVWIGALLLAIGVGTVSWGKKAGVPDSAASDMTLFAVTASLMGSVGFLAFLWMAQLPTQPWQYLPLVTFVAVCLDAALVTWSDRYPIWRLVFVMVMVCAPLPEALKLARCRQTNIDLLIAKLDTRATSGDLIIVYPWYCGVTFGRYYRGQTPWTTLPAVADHRFHRYDLLKEKLRAAAPIAPILDQAAETLRSGNNVWIVGALPLPPPNEGEPPRLPPAPNGPWGWLDLPYSYHWGRQTGHFLRTHAARMVPVLMETEDGVNPEESLSLWVVQGWRGE